MYGLHNGFSFFWLPECCVLAFVSAPWLAVFTEICLVLLFMNNSFANDTRNLNWGAFDHASHAPQLNIHSYMHVYVRA